MRAFTSSGVLHHLYCKIESNHDQEDGKYHEAVICGLFQDVIPRRWFLQICHIDMGFS